mmetsp:Transcript_78731/g.197816  ORF Transcript_78731/g.197816 Transcript_78731/m.197816 type:complete len:335 (-) Transcript_78731:299-1303(-)
MARPRDVTGNGRQVAHQWRSSLALLVLILYLVQLLSVVVKDHTKFRLQVCPQVLTLQDALQLVQQLERRLDRGDLLKGLVDELAQVVLQVLDPDVELHVVTIELVLLEVQEVVALRLEGHEDGLEGVHQGLHAVETMLGERGELLNGLEHVDQFVDPTAEEVEATKNQRLAEVKLLALWQFLQRFLGDPVLLLIGHVQLDAGVQVVDEDKAIFSPQGLGLLALEDTGLASCDHLVGDFGKELGHALSSVVVPGDREDHLSRIHQGWQGLDDRRRAADIERLDEFFQAGEVLNVVLCLVEGLRDTNVDLLPATQRVEDALPRLDSHILVHFGNGL